ATARGGGMTPRRPTSARRRPGRPPGPSQAPQLRVRLIEEASRLYAEGGSVGLSFAVVAARAGLTKATVFHYFPNKAALLRAVFEAFGARLERAAEGWFAPRGGSHAARLDRLVEGLVAFYGREPLNARMLGHALLEVAQRAPWYAGTDLAPLRSFDRFVQHFSAFIAAGVAAGEFYPDRPMATIMTIGGIILFEFMLPDQGRAFRGGASGDISLAARTAEMRAVIARAVVRPRTRLDRRRRTP
ncbi:MAG: TetR/AcrR family transcriptional regulator, partial [Deltaproteobacteria bacterium]|nr:TetR/AcrR family transcriptional regulator [Deltaproteobacteria bacterium]